MKHILTHAEANVRLIRAAFKCLGVSDDEIVKTSIGEMRVSNINEDLSIDMISALRKFVKGKGVSTSFDDYNGLITLVLKFEAPVDECEE
jgi:hypothetical protein